jgi:DNA polymerase III sliding clamp (beta) subunit (PCNA family)
MLRKDLVDRLDLVKPSLATNDLVPILTHISFLGDSIQAYNDRIGMSVPFKTDFVGGVPGKLLMDLLGASKAKDVEFIDKNQELEIKAASSRFKLPVMPEDAFVFDMPKPTDKPLPIPLKQFAQALEGCLRSVSSDTDKVSDQTGVTLIANGQDLQLFSTNNATISMNTLKPTGKLPFKDRIILPALFCEQLVKLSKDYKDCQLELRDDHALLSAKAVSCFGRFLNSAKPINFAAVVEVNLKGVGNQLRPIPSKLRLMVERAMIITQASAGQALTEIRVKDGIMHFMSKSQRGEVVDSVQVDQDDADLALDPKYLKVGLTSFYDPDEAKSGQMLMTDQCFIMSRGADRYLMAGSSPT